MKVFISWSGEISHKVAITFRDWLPSVIQSVEPYVSSEDIDKGARWSTDIASELSSSGYGLICITADNLKAPWINFEAGALGKSVDKARVSPFLFNVKRSQVDGPILQFQSTIFEKEDVLKLLRSINATCGVSGIEDIRLDKTFEVWWPQLEKSLSDVLKSVKPEQSSQKKTIDQGSILEEILELTRRNHRLLRESGPFDYLVGVGRKPPRVRALVENRAKLAHKQEAMLKYDELLSSIKRLNLLDDSGAIQMQLSLVLERAYALKEPLVELVSAELEDFEVPAYLRKQAD